MKALDVAEAYADQKIIGIVEKKAKETPPKEKKTKRERHLQQRDRGNLAEDHIQGGAGGTEKTNR